MIRLRLLKARSYESKTCMWCGKPTSLWDARLMRPFQAGSCLYRCVRVRSIPHLVRKIAHPIVVPPLFAWVRPAMSGRLHSLCKSHHFFILDMVQLTMVDYPLAHPVRCPLQQFSSLQQQHCSRSRPAPSCAPRYWSPKFLPT